MSIEPTNTSAADPMANAPQVAPEPEQATPPQEQQEQSNTNEPNVVDPDTDDLDAFSDLLIGKAKAAPKKEPAASEPVDDSSTPDDAPNADPELDEDGNVKDAPAEEKPKKVNRYQERINELTRQAREAERALEALRAEQTKTAESANKPTPAVASAPTGPTPDDVNEDGSDKYPLGEFDPAYIRDVARHTIDQEWTKRQEQETQQREAASVEAARAQLQEQWVEKLTPATEQYEDFLDKTVQLESAFDGLDPGYSDYLVQTIKSLDHGPDVLYYMANHLDEAQALVKAGPLAATLALGEYNAMFKGQTRKDATKVSNAPPPPQANKGSTARVAVSGDTDDLDAFSQAFFKSNKRSR